MKRLLIAGCIFMASVSCLAAQASVESIETLLRATNAQALLESMYANMEQGMRQGMIQAAAGHPMTDEQKRVIDTAPRKFVQVVREEITWDKLKPIYVGIYQETLTQEEVDGLIAFYRSPAGAALVNKLPVVMQRSMVAVQGLMGPLIEKMKSSMQEALSEAKIAK